MEYYKKIKSKIITSWNELDADLARWKFQSKNIVFTNGCFDIVHMGHVEYLSKAASLGQVLILGLNSDSSVTRIKGPKRPVQPAEARSLLLAAFEFIDKVVLFDEDTPYELIKFIQPDILVKGSDYHVEDIVGYDIVKAKQGTVETIDLVEGYSTTSLISKIKEM